jgi:hypothetical protein
MTILIDTPEKLEAFIQALSGETKKQRTMGFVDLVKVADEAGITAKNKELNEGA